MPVVQRLARVWLNLPLSAKGGAIITVPVMCTFFMLLLLADLQSRFDAANLWVLHTESVLSQSGNVMATVLGAEDSARDYALTHEASILALHRETRARLSQGFDALLRLVADNPAQQEHIRHAMRLMEEEGRALDGLIAGSATTPPAGLGAAINSSRHRTDTLKAELAAFEDTERRLLTAREQQSLSRRDGLRYALWGFCVAGMVAGFTAALLFSRSVTRRLERIADNAGRFARRESAGPVDRSSDEIGRVEETLIATARSVLDREQRLLDNAAELEQARNRAEDLTRAKTDFVNNISHEIRSPMNAVIGAADLLAKTELSDQQAEYVRILNRGGSTLLSVINEVLDHAKIESGRLELDRVAFDCRALVDRVVDILSVSASEKSLELFSTYSPEAPAWVMGDPNRLQRVLLNLAGNAIKFTETGSVAIRVAPSNLEGMVHFSVADTGIGIAHEQQQTIFEKFNQAGSSGAHRDTGTGLGLAISKHIVELMGGRMWVQSSPGSGSTFHFTAELPAAPEPAPAAPEPAREAAAVSGARATPLGTRILLAEDSASNVVLMKAYLAGSGCTLETAADGESALQRLTTERFHLVLMDVQMPKLDGYEVTRRFREFEQENNRPRTPVVALTAHAFQEDIDRAIRAGADGHLTKPIRRETLLDAVELYHRADDTPDLRVDIPEFLRELAPEFLRRQRLGLLVMATALREGEFDSLRILAHNMKGVGRSFGFPHLTDLGREMELAAKDRDHATLRRQMSDLREYLTAVDIA